MFIGKIKLFHSYSKNKNSKRLKNYAFDSFGYRKYFEE